MGHGTVAKARQEETVGTLECLKSCQMWGFTTSIQLRVRCRAIFGGISTPLNEKSSGLWEVWM